MKTDVFQWKNYHKTARLNIRCSLGTRLFSEDKSRRPPYSTTRMHQTCYRWDGYQNGYQVSQQEPQYIYIPPNFVNNPNNKYNPKHMPLTIFNLSKFDHLYTGRDTIVAFANIPEFETYNVEIANEDKIKEHLAKPRNWVPQRHETLPEIPSDTAAICPPADVPGHHKVHLLDKEILCDICQRFEELCEEYGQAFLKHNEDISRTKLVKMDVDTEDSPPVSSRPYT